jgi:hypothetical protein
MDTTHHSAGRTISKLPLRKKRAVKRSACLKESSTIDMFHFRFNLPHNFTLAFTASYIYRFDIRDLRDSSVGIATELQAGRSGDRIPVEGEVFAPVQTGPGAHPASCIMCIGSFPGLESGRGVKLTPHPLLVPRSKNRVELYLYSP